MKVPQICVLSKSSFKLKLTTAMQTEPFFNVKLLYILHLTVQKKKIPNPKNTFLLLKCVQSDIS